MKYRYSVVSGQTGIDGHYTRRPIVQVAVSRDGKTRAFLALINSGADQIMMPAAIAELFGIERDQCPRRTSMGVSMEPMDGFVSHLTLQIAHQDHTFDAPVIFVDTDVPVLLGREGFFNCHRINFQQDRDTFEIRPAPRR